MVRTRMTWGLYSHALVGQERTLFEERSCIHATMRTEALWELGYRDVCQRTNLVFQSRSLGL